MSKDNILIIFNEEAFWKRMDVQKCFEEKNYDRLTQDVLRGIKKLNEIDNISENYIYDLDWENLQEGLLQMQSIADILQDKCLKYENKWLFFAGKYVSMCNRTVKKFNRLNDEEWFVNRTNNIVNRKYVKRFLKILFDNDSVQHKEACDLLNIQPSELTRIVKPLCKAGYIHESKVGKNKYYSLSMIGRNCIKKYGLLSGIDLKPYDYIRITTLTNNAIMKLPPKEEIKVDVEEYQKKPKVYTENYLRPNNLFFGKKQKIEIKPVLDINRLG